MFRLTRAAIAIAALTSACGVLLVAGALEGFMRVPVARWERVGMFISGFSLIDPGVATDLAGLVLALVVLRRQVIRSVL